MKFNMCFYMKIEGLVLAPRKFYLYKLKGSDVHLRKILGTQLQFECRSPQEVLGCGSQIRQHAYTSWC
jgi:hypothetical protein